MRSFRCVLFLFSLCITDISHGESYKDYVVGSGETLSSIAKKHDMSLAEIIRINDIKPENSMLKFGQKIKVSSSDTGKSKSIEESKSSGNGMVEKEHIVGADETISSISKKYNLKMKSIIDLNNLNGDTKLKFGQKIKVLVEDNGNSEGISQNNNSKNTTSQKDCYGEYAVKGGDTLLGIKNKLDINLNDMLSDNDLTLDSKMKIGQKIKYRKSNCKVSESEKPVEKKTVVAPAQIIKSNVSDNEDSDEKINIQPSVSPALVQTTSANKVKQSEGDDSGQKISNKVSASKSSFVYPVSYSSIKQEHDGMVFAVKSKAGVSASSKGKVVYVGNDIKAISTLVMVSAEDGHVVLYGNLGSIKVKNGQSVSQGDTIGNAEDSKVYFAVRKNGKFINPESVLDK